MQIKEMEKSIKKFQKGVDNGLTLCYSILASRAQAQQAGRGGKAASLLYKKGGDEMSEVIALLNLLADVVIGVIMVMMATKNRYPER